MYVALQPRAAITMSTSTMHSAWFTVRYFRVVNLVTMVDAGLLCSSS